MVVSKTSDNIQIIIKKPNPSQHPPESSKAKNEDLQDIKVLCTFKIKIESQNSDRGCIKDRWTYPNQNQDAKPQSGISSILQSPQKALKDIDVLCPFKIRIENRNLDLGCIKDHWPYPNQYQNAKPQSGTSSFLKGPKAGLKVHGCSLHLPNQGREAKFKSWLY